MKKSFIFLMLGFVVFVCLPVTPASGDQWDITVPDAGFDDHVLANPGDYIDIADPKYDGAWECVAGDAWVDYLYWANQGYPEDLLALSGNNKAYAYGDQMYQILDETFIEGGTYTLSVWVGQPWTGGRAWWLYFTTEDYTNNLATASGEAPLSWGQVSLVYTATAADAYKKIGIKMGGSSDVAFEDVTLSYDGPPRPPIATNPVPADGAEHGDDWVFLAWDAAAGAVEHDVYFGTSFDDVNNATASEPPVDPYKGRQTETIYEVSVLVPGTTYYWRIDEVNDLDPGSPYKGQVWSFWLAPWEPTNPSPPDGAMYMDPNIDLSWKPGFQASMHEVFFGTDPCSLSAFPKSTEPTCDPGPLLKDTTYYWQVKEYQPQGRRTLGPIWSFSTTLPTMGTCLYEYWDGITPTGTSLSLLYNWPDFPHYPTGTMELTLFEGPTNRAEQFGARIRAWLYAPVTGNYKFWIATDDNGELWLSSDENPANKKLISWVGAWASPRNWTDPDVIPSGPIPLVAGQKYYIEALMKEGGGGDNIAVGWTTPWDDTIQVIPGAYLERFVQMPAWDPSPADGAMGVPRPVTLRWWPGEYAAQHQVYFGTSEASMTLQDTLALGTEEYGPLGTLDLGRTYYWKVNEVNVAGPDPGMWEGNVWSFTVAEYIVVDDMEDYNDRTAIITVWRDGYRGAGFAGNSGSNVTVSTESDDRDPRLFGDGPPWPVRDSEAMQFAYDNDGSITIYVPTYDPYTYSADANYYSEAKAGIANLPIGPNWTQGGVKALTLWFYGDAGNAIEPMWVKLTDKVGGSGKVTYGDYGEDPNDLKDPSWHEWNIAMSDFGVDLADVNNISIGFGDESNRTTPGGSGVVFFDDIRLYTPRCILSLRSPDFARADYIEDCVVDYKELEIIVENWLAAEPIMVPIPIDNPGFEDPVLADGDWNYMHQGWGWVANGESLGTWNPGLFGEIGYGGDAPEGQNVGWTNAGGVGVPGGFAQVLTDASATLNADTTYKLTVDVGNTAAYPWNGYSVQLLAGGTPGDTGEITVGTLLAEDANSLTIAIDTFETSTVTYTYNPALHSHLLGEPLQIRLLSLGNISADDETEADFDNVKLFRSVKLYEDLKVNFKDYALIASKFLEEDMFP